MKHWDTIKPWKRKPSLFYVASTTYTQLSLPVLLRKSMLVCKEIQTAYSSWEKTTRRLLCMCKCYVNWSYHVQTDIINLRYHTISRSKQLRRISIKNIWKMFSLESKVYKQRHNAMNQIVIFILRLQYKIRYINQFRWFYTITVNQVCKFLFRENKVVQLVHTVVCVWFLFFCGWWGWGRGDYRYFNQMLP